MPEMLTGSPARRQRVWDSAGAFVLRALFVAALYRPGARYYDAFTRIVFAGEWRRWQATAIDCLPPGGVVVELGCGTGALAASARGRFEAWIGLDISHQMINIARHHHGPPATMVIRANATSMPLRAGTADAVVATFPTRYIYETAVLDDVRRVLKPHGRLVVIMTGELGSVGVRRRCIHAITRILEGDPEAHDRWPPAFPGFTGRFEWKPTAFGRALVYVGEPIPTTGGGCSQPPGVAAEHAPGHRPATANRRSPHSAS